MISLAMMTLTSYINNEPNHRLSVGSVKLQEADYTVYDNGLFWNTRQGKFVRTYVISIKGFEEHTYGIYENEVGVYTMDKDGNLKKLTVFELCTPYILV